MIEGGMIERWIGDQARSDDTVRRGDKKGEYINDGLVVAIKDCIQDEMRGVGMSNPGI